MSTAWRLSPRRGLRTILIFSSRNILITIANEIRLHLQRHFHRSAINILFHYAAQLLCISTRFHLHAHVSRALPVLTWPDELSLIKPRWSGQSLWKRFRWKFNEQEKDDNFPYPENRSAPLFIVAPRSARPREVSYLKTGNRPRDFRARDQSSWEPGRVHSSLPA